MFASRGIQFLAIGDAKLVKVWSIDHGSLDEGRITNDWQKYHIIIAQRRSFTVVSWALFGNL